MYLICIVILRVILYREGYVCLGETAQSSTSLEVRQQNEAETPCWERFLAKVPQSKRQYSEKCRRCREGDACEKQLGSRLIVEKSPVLHVYDRQSIRNGVLSAEKKKFHILPSRRKKPSPVRFLKPKWDNTFDHRVVCCKLLTVAKLSLPIITTRWKSVLVIHVLFSRHERSPLLFYLLPLFF